MVPLSQLLEQAVECLIAFLDLLDPDPHLEVNGDAEGEPDRERHQRALLIGGTRPVEERHAYPKGASASAGAHFAVRSRAKKGSNHAQGQAGLVLLCFMR
jgi:hypothetical protein